MTELDWYSQQLFPPTWGQGRRRRQAWSPWGNWWNSAVSLMWGSPALVGQSANNKQVMSALCVFQDNYQTRGIKHYQCWTNTPSLGHQARATSMRNRQVLPIHFLHCHCILLFVCCLTDGICCENLQAVLYCPSNRKLFFGNLLWVLIFFPRRLVVNFGSHFLKALRWQQQRGMVCPLYLKWNLSDTDTEAPTPHGDHSASNKSN